jgi:hypothetical protein
MSSPDLRYRKERMHKSILSGDELRRYATKQVDLWIEFGWVEECDREAEIERLIDSSRQHNSDNRPI